MIIRDDIIFNENLEVSVLHYTRLYDERLNITPITQ